MKPIPVPIDKALVDELERRFPLEPRTFPLHDPIKMAIVRGQREVVDLITSTYAEQNNLTKEVQIVFRLAAQSPASHRTASGAPGGGSSGQSDPTSQAGR
jgi:hypothetical protein